MRFRITFMSILGLLSMFGCAYGNMQDAKSAASLENCWASSEIEVVSEADGDQDGLVIESCREASGERSGDIYYVTTTKYRRRLVSEIYHEGGKPYFTFYNISTTDFLFVAFGYDVMEGEGLWDYELYDVSSGELCTAGQTVLKPDIYPYIDECIDSAP